MKTISVISWNVNGIRAVMEKGFPDFLSNKKPDILGVQEVKINDMALTKKKFSADGGPVAGWDFAEYEEYWNSAKKPGYAGTAIFLKNELKEKVLSYTGKMGVKKFDEEGRVQTLEFDKFYLLNIYFPHTRHDLSRLDFKLEFDDAVLKYVKKLTKKKSVVVIGDYNVANQEIDLARPDDNEDNPGFLPEEREWMSKFLNLGLTDSFRYLHPQTIKYSWWTYRFKARERNIGWRIDYVITSNKLKNKIKNAYIWDEIEGSDHCPVGINIEM